MLLMGLRLREGIDLARWQNLAGARSRPAGARVSSSRKGSSNGLATAACAARPRACWCSTPWSPTWRCEEPEGREATGVTRATDTPSDTERTFRVAGSGLRLARWSLALYLVATPIGNLGDITIRALETLAAADVVACEDTRVTRGLLERYGIPQRPFAYHEHNAETVGPKLIAALADGRSVALVSDAGTPLVSDPGYRLASEAIGSGHSVVPMPGASAPLAALRPRACRATASSSPASCRRRTRRAATASPRLPAWPRRRSSSNRRTASPRRFPRRRKRSARDAGHAVCRELTKMHEEIARGTLAELAAEFGAREQVRGEIVLVIGPAPAPPAPEEGDVEALLADLLSRMPPAKAAREAALRTGLDRKSLYQRLLSMKGGAS